MSSQPRPATRPSIRDVAREAGVSAQTVSRVANGSPAVTPATRERVNRAMERMGYVPNRAARVLRQGRSHTIGVMAHRFERTGESLTMGAVVRAAEEHGYSVTLTGIDDLGNNDWESTGRRMGGQALDGLVIIRNEAATPETLTLPNSIPIAVHDSRLVGHHPAVVTDQQGGTRLAIDHLLGLGHRQVFHVAGPPDSEPAKVRLDTWRRTLWEAGIEPPEALRGDWSAESGYRAGLELARDPGVTAVFCANDETAMGLMRAMHEAGRRVPQEVSVVGFDDVALSAYGPVPLTTVHQDFETLGRELVRLVLEQMEPGGGRTRDIDRVTVPTRLVVRASTAPPPDSA